jgi:multiple sugar transport system permease protein
MSTSRLGRKPRPLSPFRKPLTRACFFIPAAFLLTFLVIIPVASTVTLSFFDDSGAFAGLDNYGTILSSPETVDLRDTRIPYGTLVNNLLWIAIHLPMSLFTGLFLALLLQKARGASVVKSFIFLGMVTPMIVGGIILRFLFDERSGVVPRFFGAIGVDGLAIQWTQFPSTLLFGLIFGSVWLWTGFSFIVYSAGITTIPKDYFEAAQIDGASAWRTFRRITWPLLRPMTIVVITMTVLWELKLFDVVFAATNTQGGVSSAADVLAMQMFRYAFASIPPSHNLAATVATILTLLTLLSSAWLFRRMVTGGKPERPGLFLGLVSRIVRPIRRLLGRKSAV